MLSDNDKDFFDDIGLGETRHPTDTKESETLRQKILIEEKKRKNYKIYKRFKSILFVLVGLVIIFTLIFTPIIKVKNITVHGAIKTLNEKARKLAELKTDDTYIFFLSSNVKSKILKEPYIKDVVIKKKFLDVDIKITPRKKTFFIKQGNKEVIIGDDGVYMDKNIPTKGMIEIIGLKIVSLKLSEPLSCSDQNEFESVVKTLNSLIENRVKVKICDLSSKKIYINKNFYIEGTLTNIEKYSPQIRKILVKLKKKKINTGKIIIGENKYFVYSPIKKEKKK